MGKYYLTLPTTSPFHTLATPTLLLSLSYVIKFPYKEAFMPWTQILSVALVILTTIANELNKK